MAINQRLTDRQDRLIYEYICSQSIHLSLYLSHSVCLYLRDSLVDDEESSSVFIIAIDRKSKFEQN